MGPDETHDLVKALVEALDQRGHIDGSRLLELMRTERSLMEGLRFVRKEIAAIVERTMPPD